MIYCQAPLMAHVNDDPQTWAALWRAELAAGAVPYYMFVARDTGPQAYFEVPLDRAWGIFTTAYASLPGLARTVRGPVMSATPGKVVVDFAESRPDGDPVLHLRFLQARDPRLVGRPFRARMRDGAAWLDDLEVLPGEPDDIRAAVASAATPRDANAGAPTTGPHHLAQWMRYSIPARLLSIAICVPYLLIRYT